MNYVINEILPGKIKVTFENDSWAIVPISPESTPEEIDIIVSKYDPDFLPIPEDLINKNITIGEERLSKPEDTTKKTEQIQTKTTENYKPLNTIKFGVASPYDVILFAFYYSEFLNDNRLKDEIIRKIESIISYGNFSIEDLIYKFNFDGEDIFMLAEQELSTQQNQNG